MRLNKNNFDEFVKKVMGISTLDINLYGEGLPGYGSTHSGFNATHELQHKVMELAEAVKSNESDDLILELRNEVEGAVLSMQVAGVVSDKYSIELIELLYSSMN